MVETKKMNSVTVRCDEIADLIADGTLDAKSVSKQLQQIIDTSDADESSIDLAKPTALVNPWRSAQEQIERASKIWKYDYIPQPPDDFIPRTESEVLLLHMPTTLMKFRDIARTFVNFGNINVLEPIYTNPYKEVHTRPVWLGFDPKYGVGKMPLSTSEDSRTVGPEIMSALIQFPDWPKTWLQSAPMPVISGYQLGNGNNNPITLCFDRQTFVETGWINIEVYPMDMTSENYALPRIRVLN